MCWTGQSALHCLHPMADLFIPTRIRLLWEAFSHASITARRLKLTNSKTENYSGDPRWWEKPEKKDNNAHLPSMHWLCGGRQGDVHPTTGHASPPSDPEAGQ